MESKVILIGYSGHAYVAYSILKSAHKDVYAYCDSEYKESNPFNLQYLGDENTENAERALKENDFFIAIGNNMVRNKVYKNLALKKLFPCNAIHSTAIICSSSKIGSHCVMIGAGAIINPLCDIANGVICNTGCIIEHDCTIGYFAHIAPGAVLCGNVSVGEYSFIGAGSVIKQGITIGKNVVVGAGSVVIKNIPDNATVYGNPAKLK